MTAVILKDIFSVPLSEVTLYYTSKRFEKGLQGVQEWLIM